MPALFSLSLSLIHQRANMKPQTKLHKINPLDFTTALDSHDSLDYTNLSPVQRDGDGNVNELGQFSIASAGDVTRDE